jgi:alpha-beta hydrolase superfamily lysophospholipase
MSVRVLVHAYINHELFNPPQPLLVYPLQCAKQLAEDDVACPPYSDFARKAYDATHVPCVCAERARPKRWAVYFHGNSENLATLFLFIRDLSVAIDATVFALEYPGYYAGDEAPSEKGCFAAADRFVEYLKTAAPPGVPVVFVGYSMGCAVALHAAHTHKGERFPAAVALLAPFVSAASVRLAPSRFTLAASFLWAPVDVFQMKQAALQQGHPILIFAAENDEVIPAAHPRAIYELARKHGMAEFDIVPGATHASIRSDRDGVVYPAMRRFFEKLGI